MQLSIYLSSFSSTCFGLTCPSSGAMDVTISFTCVAYGVLGLVRLGVGPEDCVCSTHTPQDRHLTTPRTPYATYVKKL